MRISSQQLAQATGAPIMRALNWVDVINDAMEAYEIDTPQRVAMFLAQIGHESGSLLYVEEIWGPTTAQLRYEGRADLGNTQEGDGERFKGHGLIQTTGRTNHAHVRDRLRAKFPDIEVPDFEDEPEALKIPKWAAYSAADFWDGRGLNSLADVGEFELITRRINGGLNGQEDRLVRLKKAEAALA